MPSIIELLRSCEQQLFKKNIPNPRVDSECLLAYALGCNRLEIFLKKDFEVTGEQLLRINRMLERRLKREPLQYIIGETNFYGLSIKVDKNVLIPRSETEELVELIISKAKGNESILDLGTGSGAIAIALAKNLPRTKITACDISVAAMELAKINVRNNDCENITLFVSNWFEKIHGNFDIIVSNPPYLTEEEYFSAEDEVRIFEPKIALTAKNGGLQDIFQIIEKAKFFLNPNGWLAIETGISQHKKIEIFSKKFFKKCESKKDLSGRDRFLIFSQKSSM